MLQPPYSRQRQHRLLQAMQQLHLDAIVLGSQHHVYWTTTHRAFWLQESAFILFSDGKSWLATANNPASNVAADEIVGFEATSHGTQRQDQPAKIADLLLPKLQNHRVKKVGIDTSAVTAEIATRLESKPVVIEPQMHQLRRRKDADELALMKKAIACSLAMHARARQIIEPGLPELQLFTELNAAAILEAGEPLSALLGNDYACGVPGGAPRKDHTAQAGQIYILDIGPAYRGYFADNARGYSVDHHPTDIQMKTWNVIAGVFPLVEKLAKPGSKCVDLYSTVDNHLKSQLGQGMTHHLGHGVGLQPHEFPHLNPKWDDVLIEGELFTVEPGIYSKAINGGIRLENQYLVTATGVENLVEFPLGLV